MKVHDIKEIIGNLGLHPNKRLGQNFLVSPEARERIVGAMECCPADRVLEIGPGLGSLTELLLERAGHVTAVEIDAGFCRYLSERFGARRNFTLIHGDFLKDPPPDGFTKIASNLPYYCSSEMLFQFTRYTAPRVYVMLQKELADRVTASPGGKSYGALTVTLGFYYETRRVFTVPRESFYPRPDVMSAFLKLSRRAALPLAGGEIGLFHLLVKSAFWGRRKTILAALSGSPHMDIGREGAARILAEVGIDRGRRGEELGLEEYIALARAMRGENISRGGAETQSF
ncbi:MAG TPA: 16S rRNA (adenine(1518)-N(6)/adenine(1519)-N(6))-dimethyltransferase RsmA [Spirochaetota bacterium]|nr:16S rRNA (adenine(1518)-N(6)/adenine(1519)-N(6))-dimethyltransferase RsmA [Spirochaetota bacterium]HPC41716.1 16S rRNA (adenine(1518)-N(6)/adenine(1519)-N(6))-dimethyltransferase RsmA [Spirochaetota bacterium]HQF09259.1 16S rRNA (adenine(1518)-N(6)/adenine(1519)-N(6))-dimethyltransferase RsmA [Spirochaetota bacterium]HQH98207.1 16S rRNA (adenine(1518)-N(6)/adenine(1519)-N(6))-dimethyltransferase RsmA [Spirochaetota bacterium]HQJ70366.1 16S rRNA (adenine(1518)-N(6)/adenine(1519)-N(6))-dimethy